MADESLEEEAPPCDPAALLELHKECCTLEYILESGYWLLPGDRVALRDGRVGVVTGFQHILEGEEDAADDESYAVLVDETEVQCAPDTLTSLVMATETAATEAATAAAVAAGAAGAAGGAADATAESLTVARALPHFRAGTLFSGDIAIPGNAGFAADMPSRQEYTLYIVGHANPDALGNTRLRARHEAYGDEQTCDVTLRDVAVEGGGGVSISYSDNETFCEGRLHVDLGHDGAFGVGVAGEVKQLVQAQAGFWEPADEVTHTFRLGAPQPDAQGGDSEVARRGQARARVRLEERQGERLRACTALAAGLQHVLQTGNPALALGDGPGAVLSPVQRAQLKVRFGDLVRNATRASEDECAAMRHHAVTLDALTFEDATAKTATLARLAAAGLTRAALHVSIDAVVETLRAVLILARFVRYGMGSAVHSMQNGHLRMTMNYERVDKSLSCAEKRLPLALVRSWRVPVGTADTDEPCAICMSAVAECDDGDGDSHFLKLPCGHAFHEECVQGWLDNNPTCPNCRSELGAAADEAEARVSRDEHQRRSGDGARNGDSDGETHA